MELLRIVASGDRPSRVTVLGSPSPFHLAWKAQERTGRTDSALVSGLEGKPPRFPEAHLYMKDVIQNQEVLLSLSPL